MVSSTNGYGQRNIYVNVDLFLKYNNLSRKYSVSIKKISNYF